MSVGSPPAIAGRRVHWPRASYPTPRRGSTLAAVLTQMLHQGVAGLSALQFQALCLFDAQPGIVSCPCNILHGVLEKANGVPVACKKVVAGWTVHGLRPSILRLPLTVCKDTEARICLGG